MKKRIIPLLLCMTALLLCLSAEAAEEMASHTMEAKLLTPFAQGAVPDGTTVTFGDEDYFTLVYSEKTKVDESIKEWEDGYTSAQRVNFGGKMTRDRNHIRFTTLHPFAKVTVWWVEGGDNNRQIGLWDEKGTELARTDETLAKNQPCLSVLTLNTAGTFLLGGATANNYIFKVTVTEYDTEPESELPVRAAWDTVPAPAIENVNTDGTEISLTVTAPVGVDGADSVELTVMKDGKEYTRLVSSRQEENTHPFTFTANASGLYTLTASVQRKGEQPIAGEPAEVTFVLPLAAPQAMLEENRGGGTAVIRWNAVPEAEYYTVLLDGNPVATVTGQCTAELNGLPVGTECRVSVIAMRGSGDASPSGEECVFIPSEKTQAVWNTTVFGTSTSLQDNGTRVNGDGSVTVWSENGKGKIVPASTDGLCFYYTRVNVKENNFVLSGTIHVDSWTFSNGQEGFGIAAMDSIGPNGSKDPVWTNSIMGLAAKVEYKDDNTKVTMKLGIGALSRLGVTAKDAESFRTTGGFVNADGSAGSRPEAFVSEMTALEKSCAALGKGTYNIIGNYTGNAPMGDQKKQDITVLHFTLTRDNTGWRVRYTSDSGIYSMEKLYRDPDRTGLCAVEPDAAYIGFFAARNARITVRNLQLTFTDPAEDAPAEEEKTVLVPVEANVESAGVTNSSDYPFVFLANADGTVEIMTPEGESLFGPWPVSADQKLRVTFPVAEGKTEMEAVFTPAAGYAPAENALLASYNKKYLPFTVEYRHYDASTLWIASDGTARGDGSPEKPLDLSTALSFARPGQTLLLTAGTYKLYSAVTAPRGVSGNEDEPITLMADPEASSRPVLDFMGMGGGLTVGGDRWVLSGFDITRSADGSKGLQLSGSYITARDLRAYKNGNTGIQISRFKSSDLFDEWPHDDLVSGCLSYMNADPGYEDADGFAAKLTCGEGNVFEHCIAAFNADDGWDLYAKVETSSIGRVTVKNCAAFMNGFVLNADGTVSEGGNGNGFKLGGESLPGGHTLISSVSFRNKAKGIDSNSCPDIRVEDCVSYDNGAANIAFYTNNAPSTAFAADGVRSLRSKAGDEDNIKLKGTQDESAVYGSGNYYCNGSASLNRDGEKLTLDSCRFTDDQAVIDAFLRFTETGVWTDESGAGLFIADDGTLCLNGFMEPVEEE